MDGKRPKIDDSVPQLYRNLIEKCWKQDRNDRPTAAEIIKSLEKKNNELESKVKEYESILLPSPQAKSENFFIDNDEEGATSITYKIDKRTKTLFCKKVIKFNKGQTTIKDAQNTMKEFEELHSITSMYLQSIQHQHC